MCIKKLNNLYTLNNIFILMSFFRMRFGQRHAQIKSFLVTGMVGTALLLQIFSQQSHLFLLQSSYSLGEVAHVTGQSELLEQNYFATSHFDLAAFFLADSVSLLRVLLAEISSVHFRLNITKLANCNTKK